MTVGVQLSRLGLADEVGDHGSRLVLGEDAADAGVALALVGEQLLEGHVAVTLGRKTSEALLESSNTRGARRSAGRRGSLGRRTLAALALAL